MKSATIVHPLQPYVAVTIQEVLALSFITSAIVSDPGQELFAIELAPCAQAHLDEYGYYDRTEGDVRVDVMV